MKTQILPPPIARLLLAILMCLPICGSHAFAQESYAVFDEATNTLTFKHDTNKPEGAFALNEGENKPGWYKPNDYGENANIIKKVVFDASFANARPTSCYKWFYDCKDLTTIEGIEYLNTTNVTDMSNMFYFCHDLKTLDVSNFDTQNVTDMSYMFYYCDDLKTLDVSNFDTKNVTDLSYMFDDCSGLTTLDVSNFDTQNVTNMNGMFWGCSGLTILNLASFDTQNVTDMNGMFGRCSKLTILNLSSFDTQNVTDMTSMFSGCSALKTLNLSNFDTKNVTGMTSMFNGCSALKTLDLSNFDTQNVTNMESMFSNCSALTTLDISGFNTKNVTNMEYMFNGCSALKTLDLSSFDTKNVRNMGHMFDGCSTLTTIYTSHKYVTTACNYDFFMFAGCTNLVGAVPYDKNKGDKEMANYTTGYFTYKASKIAVSYALFDEATNTLTFKHDTNAPIEAFMLNEGNNTPGWWYKYHGDISKVVFDASFANARPTSCREWFSYCESLTTIEGIEYLNTENVTNMSFMFSNCPALTTLDVSKFDTRNVEDMGDMFQNCLALKTLDLSSFDTRNVEDMYNMFQNCFALKTLDLSSFDTRNVVFMPCMFESCSALTTIYASEKFVTTAVGESYDMFKGCIHLVGAVPYDKNKVGEEMANYTTGYFTYKAATGIDAPTVSDNTAAEYYDLQGRRLNAPQKGVNIVKRGKKTTKVLVK